MSSPPAGWHPDPGQPGQQRYWDGQQWTEHVAPGAPGAGPPPQAFGPGPPPPKSDGTATGCLIAGGVVAGILVLFGIIAVVALAVGGDNDDDTASRGSSDRTPATSGPGGTSGPPTSGTTSLPEQDVYEVGETAHTGDLDVTVTKVEDPFPPEEFVTVDPGKRHVGIEMIVLNTGDDAETLWSMEVTDEQGQRGTIAFAGSDRPQISGEVPAGETRRGWVVFEVEEQATDLKLRVKGNITATGSLFLLS